MDGDPVNGEPSEDGNTPITMTEMFAALFPKYLAMGMSYDEFWRGPSMLAKAYREAFEIRRHNEEWARWRQGAYFYDALVRVAPVMRAALSKQAVEPGKYPDEPWPLTERELHEREERDARIRYENMRTKLLAEAKQRREKAGVEVTDNG